VSDVDPRVLGLLAGVGVDRSELDGLSVRVVGDDPVLPTPFPIGEVAAVTIAAAAATAASIWRDAHGVGQSIEVDVRSAAASLVSFLLQRPPARATVGDWNRSEVTGLYRAADDRWVHLHGGFRHLAEGTAAVLGCSAQRPALASAVGRWRSFDLEDALADRGLCGAVVRTAGEWGSHPQGAAVLREPPVAVVRTANTPPRPAATTARPLGAVRVLDLTRVLAGPVVGRTLAEHGADVLLVNSPRLENIGAFVLDTGHGKRSTLLDLDQGRHRHHLASLLDGADVVVDGYRSGALRALGLPPEAVTGRGGVYVDVNCYGHTGPWRDRRGWEQLAQSVSGVCVDDDPTATPEMLPAAACDYTTGYAAALGALVALRRRALEGGGYVVRASLCRTAGWIERAGRRCDPGRAKGVSGIPLAATATPLGPLRHLPPVARLSRTPAAWDLPPAPLGAHPPTWRPQAMEEA
jgi:crotonobetainyl-CoA:carnitine CoA-transferase CaiB-like acyl-CoA transferase